jgi:protein tyrosine phosphatase (PTP) superfamily phosphohydrolase (DUF442 family)
MIRRILLAAVAVVVAGVAGCKHCCHHKDGLPPRGGFLADPAAPRSGVYIPPPPGGLPSSPAPAADPGTGLPPPVISDGTRNFRPAPPNGSGPQLLLPDPIPGMSSAAPRYLGDPVRPGGDLPPRQISPARRGDATVAGVSGFAVVTPGVAAGGKPGVEGFDALKARGYRSVVYLHAPAEDVSAAKDLAERKGLTFVGIPTSPEALKAAFDRFKEAIADAANRPAYVCDDTGVRAGSLWYLYFRTVDQLGDDAARVRAAALGLRESGNDEQAKFWQAVQDYLAKR